MRKYGDRPVIISVINMVPSEMCFVQYMPIVMPDTGVNIPENLKWTIPIVARAEWENDDYVYLTAKHLYVSGADCGNRPGWHTDGFGTTDKNYIWCDRDPTEFACQPFVLSDDCESSLLEMEDQAQQSNIVRFHPGTLLELDQFVVHRSPVNCTPGFQTFVKLSVSKQQYNLEGNAHNYLFDYDWDMVPRSTERNHPHKMI